MQRLPQNPRLNNTRLELALLLLTSIAIVLVVTGTIANGVSLGLEKFAGGTLLMLVAVSLGVLAASYFVLAAIAATRRAATHRVREIEDLKRRLATAESLIRAEPQILVYWEQGKSLTILAQSLEDIPGLPHNQAELLRFGFWLEHKSATELKASLDQLFATGRAFNMILRTQAGGHVEADGRAAGSRAILRLRDVAGYKRDLGMILDHQKTIARDIRSCRALLNALPSPAWLRDSRGRITWVNAAYVKAVEARDEREVIAGQLELLESRQRRAIERAHKGGKPFEDRLTLITSGEQRPHRVISLALAEATASIAVDVAALETAQGELDRLVAAYDRTLDRVATAVAIFGPDRRLTYHNAAYARLWQLDENWLRSGPEDGAIIDQLRDQGRLPEVANFREWKARLLAVYEGRGEFEDWWHLADGRVVHVAADRRPDGGVTYLYDDETERLALESRYVALTRVQGETLNSLQEGVAVFATDGRLELFNTAFARIWRMSRRELSGRPHIDEFIRNARVLYEDKATWDRIARAVTSLVSERKALDGQMLRPDASVIDYAATPLPDGATLLTFADVTDAKRYERALEERNEALEAADRLKSQFIGHVSYELRTPLTTIIGYSELLATPNLGELSDKQREYLEHISSSSKALLAIIDDILDLATIDAGALELRLGEVKPRDIIDATILALRERAVNAELTLDVAVADDVSTFVADEQRVRQILYNLVSNAVGFSREGGTVMLSCWHEPGEILFSVEDRGYGIPPDQQARAFDRFESRSQGSRHRGAGLGLSIVKSLVELHNGRVILESSPGIGTRVTVRLPERPAVPGADTLGDDDGDTDELADLLLDPRRG